MPSSWLTLPFAILMTLLIPTCYAFGIEILSDTDLDQIAAAGEVVPLQPQIESKLSGKELEAVNGKGVGPLSLGWPLAVGYNEGFVLPPVEIPASLPPRSPSPVIQGNSGMGSWARPYANSR